MTDLQQDAPSAPPPGWYPDPVRPGSTRYWSGSGWTAQVNTPVLEPLAAPVGALFEASPVVEPPPVAFAAAPPAPHETYASQTEWHQTRARPIQRLAQAPVSTSMRTSARSASAQNDPYDRNWIAGVAIVLALLSIAGLAARALWDLPILTQSIFAGAPIVISLIALARAARHRSGRVLSIFALVISVATAAAAWLVDPAVIRDIIDTIVGLIPA